MVAVATAGVADRLVLLLLLLLILLLLLLLLLLPLLLVLLFGSRSLLFNADELFTITVAID